MINAGKQFENDFKKSMPKEVKYIRVKDDMGGYAGNKNFCDCILYIKPYMFTLELKSHKGISVPFGAISKVQVDGLKEAGQYDGIVAGVVFNFRDVKKTYYVSGLKVAKYYYEAIRQSFPLVWCQDEGIEIDSKLIITRSRYDLEKFISQF